MDSVEAERVHVIREAAGAADARDEDEFFARDAELGEDHLHGGEDGVVSAAWAPADFLVGLEVFLGVDGQMWPWSFRSPQIRSKGKGRQSAAETQTKSRFLAALGMTSCCESAGISLLSPAALRSLLRFRIA